MNVHITIDLAKMQAKEVGVQKCNKDCTYMSFTQASDSPGLAVALSSVPCCKRERRADDGVDVDAGAVPRACLHV